MRKSESFDLDKFINDDYIRSFFQKKMLDCLQEIEILTDEIEKNPEVKSLPKKLAILIQAFEQYELCVKTINSYCAHDLVLHLGKVDSNEPDKGFAVCLMCKEEFSVDGLDYESVTYPENVINVDGILSPIYTKAFDVKENILVRRAREKLLKIASYEQDMPFEEVRQNILEDLVYYTDDLEDRKIIPRKRVRIPKEK